MNILFKQKKNSKFLKDAVNQLVEVFLNRQMQHLWIKRFLIKLTVSYKTKLLLLCAGLQTVS